MADPKQIGVFESLCPSNFENDINLSLEERRRQNIERNRKYLETVIAAPQQTSRNIVSNSAKSEIVLPNSKINFFEVDVDEVALQFPERRPQIEKILRYLKMPSLFSESLLFVHGPSETGKTSVLEAALKQTQREAVFVDCRALTAEAEAAQLLLLRLRQLQGAAGGAGAGGGTKTPSGFLSLLSFARGLLRGQGREGREGREEGGLVVVLENVEGIWSNEMGTRITQMKKILRERGVDFCLVSQARLSSLSSLGGVVVSFPPYSESDLLSLFTRQYLRYSNNNSESFQSLCSLSLPSLSVYSSSLRALSSALGELCEREAGRKREREKGESVGQGKEEGREREQALPPIGGVGGVRAWAAQKMIGERAEGGFGLAGRPRRLRMVILACYLAAHNPLSPSQILGEGGRNKRRRAGKEGEGGGPEEKEEERGRTLLFSLERFGSIFSLLWPRCFSCPAEGAADLSSQSLLCSLLSLGLISRAGGGAPSFPLFLCHVPEEMAREAAASLSLSLYDYLLGGRGGYFSLH